jgi:hypothetical protein
MIRLAEAVEKYQGTTLMTLISAQHRAAPSHRHCFIVAKSAPNASEPNRY